MLKSNIYDEENRKSVKIMKEIGDFGRQKHLLEDFINAVHFDSDSKEQLEDSLNLLYDANWEMMDIEYFGQRNFDKEEVYLVWSDYNNSKSPNKASANLNGIINFDYKNNLFEFHGKNLTEGKYVNIKFNQNEYPVYLYYRNSSKKDDKIEAVSLEKSDNNDYNLKTWQKISRNVYKKSEVSFNPKNTESIDKKISFMNNCDVKRMGYKDLNFTNRLLTNIYNFTHKDKQIDKSRI